ncbi:Rhodanese-like domain protein [Gimesia alba]|uniref:Rhodanese-like domain protein n=1 Tax=Gimesia alba TaxID=2527973 RepID=A0A517RHQ7_9PLAN|nr:rhodanese-like domain-containing protein [Gimesia alba]QDT43405.1 Rhodanese-like domain protein [Gimesia alba]
MPGNTFIFSSQSTNLFLIFCFILEVGIACPATYADEFQPAKGDNHQPAQGSHLRNEQQTEDQLPALNDNRIRGPYCGVNSLYACLTALGIETTPADYIKTRYIGSFEGSSAKELIDATRDFGAHAESLSHLTHRDLRRIQTPMILHVQGNRTDKNFNHWIAFLGFEGDRVRIVDAPLPLQTLTMAELLSKWDGTAIAVSKEELTHGFLYESRVEIILGLGLLAFAVYFLARCFSNSFSIVKFKINSKKVSLLWQMCIIFGFSLLLSLGYHAASDVGFLNNSTALAEVTIRYHSSKIPKLTLAETEQEISEGEPLLLDARYAIDFQRGTLPNAKSIPINSALHDRQQILAGVPRTKRIIVYCQSSGCGFADEIAQFLEFNDFKNVAVFRGGYREWSQNHIPEGSRIAQE